MARFPYVDPALATGEAQTAFAEVNAQFGGIINLFKVAANAPQVLLGILALNKAVSTSKELDGQLIEQVAMLTSALNRCDYCVNVHMKVGMMQGLSRQTLIAAMQGQSDDPRTQALLNFTNEVVRNRGLVGDATLNAVRAQGFSDQALLETIGVIGVYTTLQYIRHVGDPEHDFPRVTEYDPAILGA